MSTLAPVLRGASASARRNELVARLSADLAEVGGIRVGVDLVDVCDVAGSIAVHGAHYLERIFTLHELDCCRRNGGGYVTEALAARFAAKEAVVKVLRPRGARPEWRSIEVCRDTAGWCEIRLGGRAADLAEDAGIGELAVSISHEPDVAAAVVVARCGEGRE